MAIQSYCYEKAERPVIRELVARGLTGADDETQTAMDLIAGGRVLVDEKVVTDYALMFKPEQTLSVLVKKKEPSEAEILEATKAFILAEMDRYFSSRIGEAK